MVAPRPETCNDIESIHRGIEVVFRPVKHSDRTEQDIVARLRDDNALTVSLVAEKNNQVIGHIAAPQSRLVPRLDGSALTLYQHCRISREMASAVRSSKPL